MYTLKHRLLKHSIVYIFFIHFETLKVMNIRILNSTKLNELISRVLLPEYCVHFRDDDIIDTFFHIIK